ncbi:MAG: hypothetical protein LVQ95_02130 [Candidatus Micrarchaeales archaeon]|nr:hypothetical protein [Candidatus Micrarchaeales archaeon]
MITYKKGQFWSIDVIFAIVIFTVAITILSFTWYNVNTQLSVAIGGGSIIAQLQAHMLADNIFSTGTPPSWQSVVNTTNTSTWKNISIGLGSAPGSTNISTSKLYTFVAMASYNYQATKQKLGVGYEYEIIINGSAINITIGRNPNANGALTTFVEKRSAFLGGNPVNVEVLVWTNSTLAVS